MQALKQSELEYFYFPTAVPKQKRDCYQVGARSFKSFQVCNFHLAALKVLDGLMGVQRATGRYVMVRLQGSTTRQHIYNVCSENELFRHCEETYMTDPRP